MVDLAFVLCVDADEVEGAAAVAGGSTDVAGLTVDDEGDVVLVLVLVSAVVVVVVVVMMRPALETSVFGPPAFLGCVRLSSVLSVPLPATVFFGRASVATMKGGGSYSRCVVRFGE